jgi:hypothetical protein
MRVGQCPLPVHQVDGPSVLGSVTVLRERVGKNGVADANDRDCSIRAQRSVHGRVRQNAAHRTLDFRDYPLVGRGLRRPPRGVRDPQAFVVHGPSAMPPGADGRARNRCEARERRVGNALIDQSHHEGVLSLRSTLHGEHMFAPPPVPATGRTRTLPSMPSGPAATISWGAVAKVDYGTGLQNRRFQVRVLAAPLLERPRARVPNSD